MPRFTMETRKKIGNISKIYKEEFEVPTFIIHEEDGKKMFWTGDSYYECSCCHKISGEAYIKSELLKNTSDFLDNLDESEM